MSDATERILLFLQRIGIAVEEATLGDTFLPGLELVQGRLLVDRSALTYPGDLLHEAGHVAVAPPRLRPHLSGDVTLPGVDMLQLEKAVLPWSYAAALELGIDPALVFHEGGYRGRSAGLLSTFRYGVYPGVALLEECGMTASPARAAELGVPPYPHMVHWLRPDADERGAAVPEPRRSRAARRTWFTPAMVELELSHFAPLVGDRFCVRPQEGPEFDATLAAAEPTPYGSPRAHEGRRLPFSLLFHAEHDDGVPQQVFTLTHATAGDVELFLVPLGPQGGAMRYEAVIS